MLDCLIKGALIVDGTGGPAFQGSIGMKEGKLILNPNEESENVIEAEGLTACPGFIDFHSHGDMVLGQEFAKLCKVSQGITTEIAGQCGSSMFPIVKERIDLNYALLRLGTADFPQDMENWGSFSRYLEYANRIPLAANIKFLVGHSALRIAAMGYDNRRPTASEMETMKTYLREAMEHGAMGLSTGLIYTPSAYADTEELVELAEVLRPYGGIYASHMRNESDDVVKSVEETLEIGRRAGVPVVISHHKICGRKNWGLSSETLRLVDEAVKEGLIVTLDQYPYTASMTHLNACIPPWYFGEGIVAMAEKLKNPELRAKIRAELEDPSTPFDNYYLNCGGFTGIFISSSPKVPEAEGLFVSEYAEKTGKEPFEAFFDLLTANEGAGNAIYHCMCEEDLFRIIRDPNAVVGTDGICRALEEKAHPRAFGSFVRAICYFCREKHILPLEEMVRKMTLLPAERAGIRGKGILADGRDADLVLLDYEKLEDTPDYRDSNRTCKGVEYVFVGGRLVYREGRLTGETPGRVILHDGII